MTWTAIEQLFFYNKDKWLKEFWNTGQLNNKYFQAVSSFLEEESGMALNEAQKLNLKEFSQGKVRDLTSKLQEAKNNSLTYRDFVDNGTKKFEIHTNWLKNEGETVKNGAEQIRQWNTITRNPDRYMKWITAGDSKVRDEHRELNGVIKKVSDPFWNSQFPGRDYNCRCSFKILKDATETGAPILQSPEDVGIEVNPGKTGMFFNKKHSYLK